MAPSLIADTGNHRVRRLKDGQLTTAAGNGELSYDPSQEGVPATQAALWAPRAVAALPDGTYFVTDRFNNQVRRVDPGGNIWLFAGTATRASGASGDGGKAIDAVVGDPVGVAVGKDGSVYVSQYGEHRIRRIRPDGVIEPFAGTGTSARAVMAARHKRSIELARGSRVGPMGVYTDSSMACAAWARMGASRPSPGWAFRLGRRWWATTAKLNEPRGSPSRRTTLYVGDV
jgi:hypothetical protein